MKICREGTCKPSIITLVGFTRPHSITVMIMVGSVRGSCAHPLSGQLEKIPVIIWCSLLGFNKIFGVISSDKLISSYLVNMADSVHMGARGSKFINIAVNAAPYNFSIK